MRLSMPSMLGILRVRDWYYLVGIALLALVRHPEMLTWSSTVRVVMFSSLYLCWGYVFNNLFDQHEDTVEKNPFRASQPTLVAFVTSLMSMLLLIVAFAWNLALPTLAVMALNVVYSVPPIRLKRHLVSALVLNGVFFGFVFFAAIHLLTGAVVQDSDVAFSIFIFALFLPLQYVHHLEHLEEDGVASSRSQRIAAISFFALVVLASSFAGIVVPTACYSLVGAIVISRAPSAKKMRLELRWVSAIFGMFLLARHMF